MANETLFTLEQQIALVNGAQPRMDANANAWISNPKVKAALLRDRAEEECKKAS